MADSTARDRDALADRELEQASGGMSIDEIRDLTDSYRNFLEQASNAAETASGLLKDQAQRL
ncbi:hypothetical protein [Collinsella ihumii]|uniref:Uncharacterized protein n=1 Tax=Collinsella ihumii TaxID=1720204 RepID=A0AAW7JUF6_9ACTN|nr:hypothetical protein [Collinsella ihumii]MDN0069256.1 hypothetical protein [Collinsella ihumii]